jgi:hypothetical protein
MTPSKQAIVGDMEKLQKEQELCFTIPETFGGGTAIIHLNPSAGKRYILKVAKDLETARGSAPYWSHDKAKHIAKWVADRLGSLMA